MLYPFLPPQKFFIFGLDFCLQDSIAEKQIKKFICEKLDMNIFDEQQIKNQVDTILIHPDGSLQIELQHTEYFELLLN